MKVQALKFAVAAFIIGVVFIIFLCFAPRASAQLSVTDDSSTQQGSPKANNGAATAPIVYGSATAEHTTYIRFELSSLPAGLAASNISAATMTLFVDTVTTAGTFDVYLVDSTWAEGTITYGTAPTLGTKIASAVPVTTAMADDYLLVNVASAVQAWLSGTTNFGLALVPTAGSTIDAAFDSKDSILRTRLFRRDLGDPAGAAAGLSSPPK